MFGWIEKPKPLEEVDPFLAEEFMKIANGKHPTVTAIDNFDIVLKQRVVVSSKVGRNSPCPCGSIENGKRVKFKKCCGKN